MVEEIRKYDSISTFLNECGPLLIQNECENNVILGICNRFLNKSIDLEKLILIAAIDQGGTIISCALTTPNKTSLTTFITQTDIAIKPLANYFIRDQIDLKGVSGPIAAVNSFMEMYQKPITQAMPLLLYKAEMLKNIELVQDSKLTCATTQDIPILARWLKNFQIDGGLLPLKPDEEIQAAIEDKIKNKLLYKLILGDDQQPVTMLAIVRETEHSASISWVYTPPHSRSRGYATTAVYKLTELVINSQQKQCILFADKSNLVSNKLYQNIGFQPVGEYLDIDF